MKRRYVKQITFCMNVKRSRTRVRKHFFSFLFARGLVAMKRQTYFIKIFFITNYSEQINNNIRHIHKNYLSHDYLYYYNLETKCLYKCYINLIKQILIMIKNKKIFFSDMRVLP